VCGLRDLAGHPVLVAGFALRNAWRLVVNVERDEPLKGSKDSPNLTGQHGAARPGMTKE
jgi:hypothetical protein